VAALVRGRGDRAAQSRPPLPQVLRQLAGAAGRALSDIRWQYLPKNVWKCWKMTRFCRSFATAIADEISVASCLQRHTFHSKINGMCEVWML
jgi:hypothetical protein